MYRSLTLNIEFKNDKMVAIKCVTLITCVLLITVYARRTTKDASMNHRCVEKMNKTLSCNFVPKSVPVGVTNVHINLDLVNGIYLNNSTFEAKSWNEVKLLEITGGKCHFESQFILHGNCFKGLNNLEELNMHIECPFDIYPNNFLNLDDLATLDFSGSQRINLDDLISALNGSDKLPGLNKLTLANCSHFRNQLSIDDQFMKVLQSKKIKYLDVSKMDVSKINFTAVIKRLKLLENFNISYSNIGDFTSFNLNQKDMVRKTSVDLSYVNLPKKAFNIPPGRFKLTNMSVHFSKIAHLDDKKLFLSLRSVNISGLFPYTSTLWIENVTITLDIDPHLFTGELIFRENNIKWLDVRVICDNNTFSSFYHIDLSGNGLQFLHPDFLTCFPNLQKIDLSSNKLAKMFQVDSGLFETLFSGVRFLTNLKMSKNDLIRIPMKMFETNKELKVIDLSGNRLEQVHFALKGLSKLSILDLRGNNIHYFDKYSINAMLSWSGEHFSGPRNATVVLTSNPLSCSKCAAKSFFKWVVSTNLVDVYSQKLTCINENNEVDDITKNTLNKVKSVCRKEIITIVTSALAGIIVLLAVVTALIYYIRRKHKNRLQNRANVINMLRQGNGYYEFAVFLAFSYEDEDVVNEHILHQLNENLQLMTGIDRELVCTGDRHFRPGFYVHSETHRRLETTSVLIVVASKNFCQSAYCRSELDHAFMEKKPIILMFIEHVDQEEMTPTMRELYRRNVRVVWTVENGVYEMKTTWENVCTSILDLIT